MDMWSKFRAHSAGIAFSVVKTISLDKPRMVRVAGTAMISFNWSITSFRVRIRTGRRLSGTRNVYHWISPRFTKCAPSLRHPRQAVLRQS
jgi:hypothetical protein